MSRRLHAERSRFLQREAQCGQWRKQWRWRRRQSQLELRHRRADRRPGRRSAAKPPGQELPDGDAVIARTAMLLMGDEVRRTQSGNNNAYCQDNELSWFDWSLRDRHADVLRFVRLLNARRVQRSYA